MFCQYKSRKTWSNTWNYFLHHNFLWTGCPALYRHATHLPCLALPCPPLPLPAFQYLLLLILIILILLGWSLTNRPKCIDLGEISAFVTGSRLEINTFVHFPLFKPNINNITNITNITNINNININIINIIIIINIKLK